jgi:DNA-binding CsgD family transcriptional regulator
MSVPERDLHALVRLVNEGREDPADPGAPLPWPVLDGLRSLVPCDSVSFFQLDPGRREASPIQDAPADSADTDESLAVFFTHYWDCDFCSYPDRTGDLDRVVLASDFYTQQQFRATGMWSEYLRPLGVAHELIACVGGLPGRTVRLLMWRGPGRDFSERDRAIVWLLRPHLYRLYRDRRRTEPGPASLTERQHELLRLVAVGYTNRQIGRRLGVTESTVRKHLEHVFARLQVASRTAAVARAFPDGVA